MKRIICSILVVVMLALSLVGCGYSYAKDDMGKYAKFSDQAAFEALLKKLVIKDGEFTTDDAIRAEKVEENIASTIAKAIKGDLDKKTEGTPGSRDLVYYSYYASAVIKEEGKEDITVYFYTDKMKSSSAVSIQLRPGGDYGEDELSEKIAELLKEHSFDDYAYASATSSLEANKSKAGEVAFVTYTRTVGDKSVTYTNQKIVIGEAPADGESAATFASYLCAQKINTTIENKTFTEDGAEATYSGIKINWIASRVTSGVAKEGDKVYVTYKVDGETSSKTELVVVGAAVAEGETAASLESYLAGKKIGESLDEFTPAGSETKYTGISIEWRISDGEPAFTVKDVTFDEETEVTDITGEKRQLKDVELTYYVYPVSYSEIDEYSIEVIIDKVLGEDLTADAIYEILFVKEISALAEDATEADRDKIKEGASAYKSDDGKTIEEIVKDIVAYYDAIKTAKTALENADKKVSEDKTKYNDAKAAFEAAKPEDENYEELKAAFEAADAALNGENGSIAVQKTKQEAYDNEGKKKEDNIKKLLAIKDGEQTLKETLEKNYKLVTYDYLQALYNEEIKNNLAKEIYKLLEEYITVEENLPKKAVDEAYTQIYETIENNYYTGTNEDKKSYYSEYQSKGGFDAFLIHSVNDKYNTAVTTVKEAKAVIKEKAIESVKPVVEIFLAAQIYDQVLTDKEYEEYKDQLEEYYYYYVLYYKNFSIETMLGKTNMKTAAQFNKLMDWILEYDQDAMPATPDANGYYKREYKYKNPLLGAEKPYTFTTDAENNG